jgi:hypothetical protein
MKRLLPLLLLGLFYVQKLTAGFPVTHVVLAEMWIDEHCDFSEEQRRDCILGTLFPDIRHLGVVDREVTHLSGVDVALMKQTNDPFLLGLQLHAFVDEFEQRYVRSRQAKLLVADMPHEDRYALLKILEDEVLYTEKERGYLIHYLDTVIPQEKELSIHSTFVYMWHSLLKRYLREAPHVFIHHLARTHQNFHYASRATVKQWDAHLPELAERPEIQQLVAGLIDSFRVAIQDPKTPLDTPNEDMRSE